MKRLITAALVAGSTLRLTRFLVTDTLGQWLIVDKAKLWAMRDGIPNTSYSEANEIIGEHIAAERAGEATPEVNPGWGWKAKLVSGLGCPYCCGFWVGALVLILTVVAPPHTARGKVWRFVQTALTLNYATAHLSSRID